MLTFQDLQAIGDDEKEKKDFIRQAITDHKTSDLYKWAVDADLYIRQLNSTIMNYKKFLYDIAGKAVADNYSANYKTTSNFFKRFVTQSVNYLLANGISFENEETKKRFGGDSFDRKMYKAAYEAKIGAVSFPFWNVKNGKGQIDSVFSLREFAPLWDEETGGLSSGVRFWQLAANKPLRATLYELDGYTEYFQDSTGELQILRPKRTYKINSRGSAVDGYEIIGGENYPGFPIIPLWGNQERQSELVGLKTEIDAYDLIKSGFANDLDDVQQIYWIIHNAGGMDETDLQAFMNQLKRTKAAMLEDTGAAAEAHTTEVPYQARETFLTRLESDMYYDAMAMNAKDITAGNITATAIRAAYDNLDQKTAEMKNCIEEFLENLCIVAGIEYKTPKFKLNRISNDTETTQNVLAAAEYLDTETILRKLPFVEDDEIEGILERLEREEMDRFESEVNDNEQAGQGEETNGQEAETDGEASV